MLVQLGAEAFRGPVGRAPSLQLSIWLAWDGPGRPWRLTVVERGASASLQAREDVVSPEDVRALEALLEKTGPRVSERVDSSDTAGWVRIRALREAGTDVTIPMLSSGFEGEDAPAWRELLRRLLDLARVRDADVRRAALGE